MTAHASQGQTSSRGAIVDLKLGGSSRAMSGYVSLTRAKSRGDVVFFSSFRDNHLIKDKHQA